MEIVELKVQVEKSQLDALQAQVEALKGTKINLGTGGKSSGDPTKNLRAGLDATDKAAQRTGQSIMSVMGKVAKWTAVTTAVYAPIKAFKEALTTIKALDTEMVNVQKVTGATAAQMKKYQDQAYALASQYGRNALDVAESMTAFARAGYGDQIDQMAELSTLLQNVGYVSADTANSMLLAVDAAWHLNGSQEQLMSVLDGVDKITNQNATDFDKMARGMTVAASVFAESGESIQTFASMVGTGTAVTQRSGEEISRGLRTIMMNIRQIKGETEDGELIDGESIAKASAALKEFAGISTMENGELRKGSDVLADLAAKWKDLDSVQQSAIAEALAGKRQANILTALMGNWDMYEKQMEEYATAAGTALKENEIYMDSWAAKSEQLKSTWTEFVSGFVDTGMIKGALDGLIGAVEFLDSDLGHAVITASGLALALTGAVKAFSSISAAVKASRLVDLVSKFGALAKGEGLIAALSKVATFLGPIGIALAGFAAILATPAIVDFLSTDFSEQGQKVSELKSEYDELYGAESEYQALIEKRSSDTGLNDWEQARLAYLEQYRSELKEAVRAEQEIAASKYQEKYGAKAQSTFDEDYYRNGGRGNRDNETIDVKNLRDATKAFDELNKAATAGQKSQKEYQQGIDDILASYEEFYNETKQGLAEGWIDTSDLTEAQQELMDLYDMMMKLRDVPLDKLSVAKAIEEFKYLADIGDKTVVNWQKLKRAMEEAGASAEDIEATLQSMKQDENVVLIDVEADGLDETIENLKELDIAIETADGLEIDIDGLVSMMTQLGYTKKEIEDVVGKLRAIDDVSFVDAEGNVADLSAALENAGSVANNLSSKIDKTKKKAEELGKTKVNVNMTTTDGVSNVVGKVKGIVDSLPKKVEITLSANAGPVVAAVNTAQAAISVFQKAKSAFGLASGTNEWKGGPVLLGDEKSSDGSPRPELVLTKSGRAFVAGMTGPTMADLPAGSRVYPYADTVNIFSGRDITEIKAFGAGNDRVLSHYLNPQTAAATTATSTNTSSKSGNNAGTVKSASGSGSSKSGGGSGSGSGSGSSSSGDDKALENLKKELDLLKAQYSYLEASNASTAELREKSKEIQAKLHEINDHLKQTGGEQKDIVDNSTAWWQELSKQGDLLGDELDMLRSEYDYLESSGAKADVLNKKSEEIQNKLHEINELLRATGGSQKDIVENSSAWHEEMKKIQSLQRKAYEDERDLLETEISIMEKDKTMSVARIEKLREVQDNLHREAEYLRSIKAEQKEINELSARWWEIQSDILQIQEDLLSELDAAINKELKTAREERDKAVKVIDDEIKRLKEERDIQQDQLDLEEKRKAVTEARIALENAQHQRTVRYFNAASGQWEWAADAKAVKTATDAYKKASDEYNKKWDEQVFNLRIEALEKEKELMNSRYELLASRWETLSDSFATPLRSIEDILTDLLDSQRLSSDDVSSIKSFASSIERYQHDMVKASAHAQTGIADDVLVALSSAKKKSSALSDTGFSKIYDKGSVLSSLKGFMGKRTDEVAIPSDLAGFMIGSNASKDVLTSIAGLSYLLSAGGMSQSVLSALSSGKYSQDHYGDVYQYGNITLSEREARSMSVYDLAQRARNLSIYSAS